MRVPRATYRLQLNAGFTFSDAADLVPYLARLGVSDLYASPYMKARPGSTHGYDIIDHNALNPEIGSEKDYERLTDALRGRDMGQLLDWVPNHMGVGSDNGWWMDALENGPASPYARSFDIDWYPTNRRGLYGKVLLPLLGDHYRAVLENGELELVFDAGRGSFSVGYYEHRFPLDPQTYPEILDGLSLPGDSGGALELESIATSFGNLPAREVTDGEAVAERVRDAAIHKGRLARLCAESPEAARAIENRLRELNGRPQTPETFEALHLLLERQAYRLAYWRVASDEINYRRFFAINDLAGVRVEDGEVFEATHRFVLELIREGRVNGLRIDHPDGLYDPAGYFRRLQEAVARVVRKKERLPLYLPVEKILAPYEDLPEEWPVAGTTGYDFTNLVNGLFVDAANEPAIDRAYRRFLGREADFEELLYGCKKLIMRTALASELNVLSRRLLGISEYGRRSYDFTINVLRDALSEVVAHFPVYRTYVTQEGASEADRRYVDWALTRAKKRSTAADTAVFDFVRNVLLMDVEGPEDYRRMVGAFVMKFQQYTGPVMAKGMEDTALYRYNRLASLNEVGGEPERFGVSPGAFHHLSAERQKRWPHAMLATSTHDTKRSEDARARINVLSEIPGEWRRHLTLWGRTNRSRRREVEGAVAPDRNDEYLLYQTLVGAWPLGEMDKAALGEFRERIQAYMQKAVREAQLHTSWINVNEEYEEAVAAFVEALLSPDEHNLFLQEFLPFQRRIARLGALNSLSQTLIKLASPGVPDIYQGNELWDFSLVDPDNRRPVDYALRRKLLAELEEMPPAGARGLLEDERWTEGRPKLYLTWKALQLRRERPGLFEEGEYLPLEARGERAEHLVAFARRRGEEAAVAVAPRLYAGLPQGAGTLLPDPGAWTGTRIPLPVAPAAGFRNVLTGEVVRGEERDGQTFAGADDLLRNFPVALLVAV